MNGSGTRHVTDNRIHLDQFPVVYTTTNVIYNYSGVGERHASISRLFVRARGRRVAHVVRASARRTWVSRRGGRGSICTNNAIFAYNGSGLGRVGAAPRARSPRMALP